MISQSIGITEWEESLLETGLFEWEYKKSGQILRLIGTPYRTVAPSVWIKVNPEDSEDFKVTFINSFEEILDDVPNEIMYRLLFYLDTMMVRRLK